MSVGWPKVVWGALAMLVALAPGGSHAWTTSLDGTVPGAQDLARDVAVSAAGDVTAVGVRQRSGVGGAFEVVRLRAGTGALVWAETAGSGEATAVAVDAAGNSVAVGSVLGPRGSDDFAVVKLAPDGRTLWTRILDGAARGPDAALDVAIAGNDDVVVAGFLRNSTTGDDFVVMRLEAATGGTVWSRTLDHEGLDDRALAVAVGEDGEVAAAGFFGDALSGEDYATVRLDPASGTEIWVDVNDGGLNGSDRALQVSVGTFGDVVTCGYEALDAPTIPRFTVRKHRASSGRPFWTFHAGSAGDRALAMHLEPVGNALVTGTIDGAFAVVKVRSSDGTQRWFSSVSASPGSEGRAITVDSVTGDVFVAGVEGDDILVARLKRINGTRLWGHVFGGSAGGPDAPTAVVLDGATDLVLSSVLENAGTGDDFTVTKLSGADGTDFVPEPGEACVLATTAGLLLLGSRARRLRRPSARTA